MTDPVRETDRWLQENHQKRMDYMYGRDARGPAPITPRATVLERLGAMTQGFVDGIRSMIGSIQMFTDSIMEFQTRKVNTPRGIKPPLVPGPTVPKPADQWRQVISPPHQPTPRVARHPAGMKRPGGMRQ
jgi:hypothetical protein